MTPSGISGFTGRTSPLPAHLRRAAERLGQVAIVALAVEGEPLRLMKAADVEQARRRMQTYHARPVVVAVERWAVGDLVVDRIIAGAAEILRPRARGGSFFDVVPAALEAAVVAAAERIGTILDTPGERMDRLRREASREVGRGI